MLSRTVKYALRTLAHLSQSDQEGPILRTDLAKRVGAPSQYLAKILVTLSKAGFLNAARGTGGGYRLARPAGEITMLEIVELFDGSQVEGSCLFRDDVVCGGGSVSETSNPWCRVHRTYLDFLQTTTLADAVGCHVPSFDSLDS
jgi:Rrf2 family transcriptional regulator, iron-sulfur cluster assembly transcription factor